MIQTWIDLKKLQELQMSEFLNENEITEQIEIRDKLSNVNAPT